ncbi:hypothetical protein, partial [Dysosmobacter sp.]|uniref:hypothetical protein n=1 Tax=Dysosmobacter sp. TaxID=2591382 RepID=UPI002A8E7340
MKLLDFLNAEKRIYAKLTPLTPKIQAHYRVTEIGTCLKSRCRFFLFAFLFALSVRQLRSCLSTLVDGTFQVLGLFKSA